MNRGHLVPPAQARDLYLPQGSPSGPGAKNDSPDSSRTSSSTVKQDQVRGTNKESRSQSRDRYTPNGQSTLNTTNHTRNDYFESPCKDYLNSDLSSKIQQDFISKLPHPQEFSNKLQDYTNKPKEIQMMAPEYPCKQKLQSPSVYKAQSRELQNKHVPTMNGINHSNSPTNMIRERVASPHRVTSPPIKLSDPKRTTSPHTKINDSRQIGEYLNGNTDPSNISRVTESPKNGPNDTAHYIQQYPERDIPSSINSANVWESVNMNERIKNSINSYAAIPQPNHPSQRPPTYSNIKPNNSQEKAIDGDGISSIFSNQHLFSSTKIQNENLPSINPVDGSTTLSENNHNNYLNEKDNITKDQIDDGFDLNKFAEVTSKMAITVLPDENDDSKSSSIINNDVSHTHPSEFLEGTDCGSLSTSYSDADHIINRKRPPTKLKSKRRNILSFPQHLSTEDTRGIQRRQDSFGCGGSSSDENRSSGHASMSDGHSSSSPPVDSLPRHHHSKSNLNSVPEDGRLGVGISSYGPRGNSACPIIGESNRKGPMRPRNRSAFKDDFSLSLESASGLEDIKHAIEQLTMRSQGSRTSYSTSTYSSISGSETDPVRRLIRHSSLDTINTNITSADEFVWVDSHNRLVELQQLPWSNHDVLRVIQQGRVREQLDRVSMEAVPRLSYLLQRALVRVAREAQRLTRPVAMCSKREILSAFKIVLSPALADSCIKSCLRSAAMYTVSGDHQRQSKSARAGLNLSVSRFMRWLCDVRLGKFIHEYAAVYITAGTENLLEEIILQCLPNDGEQMLTAAALEHAIANNGDLWGLLQPYAHLNAGRTATGALCIPRSTNVNSLEKSSNSLSMNDSISDFSSLASSGNISMATPALTSSMNMSMATRNLSSISNGSAESGRGSTSSGSLGGEGCNLNTNGNNVGQSSRCSSSVTLTPEDTSRNIKSLEQILLTTCVGSLAELNELVGRVIPHCNRTTNSTPTSRFQVSWSSSSLHALFYFMRCSQLEHAEHVSRAPIQELVYERPYIVLPPLIEWVRVAIAHTEHRNSTSVDKDDVLQAARLLLPGVDCPVRMIGYEELICPKRQFEEVDCAKKLKIDLAFNMLSCGRTDMIPHALQLLPGSKVNTVNEYGLTPLMLGCIRGDESMVHLLLDAGADVDAETPPTGTSYLMANPESQHWTALTYAAIHGHTSIAKMLLEKKANVEGGARLAEEKCTETPLQVATASGHLEMLSLLLSYGANPYLSTLMKDSLCYSGAAQRGCYAAIGVAAAHGQRVALQKLLSQPQQAPSREVLSLEEILAEGANSQTTERDRHAIGMQSSLGEMLTTDGYSIADANQVVKLSKQQIKTLQEAMYHSAESGHLEITLDLRNLGVPWTLHCWMHTLATAHEHRLESIINQLLQDFLQDWPEDSSTQFVDECLPLLFTIFRYSKNEGTSLLLADIFSSCFGKEAIKIIKDTTISSGARIDPKYVNNPELSDVQFRVEGRVFYAHKIILVNASYRFRQMLTSKVCEGNPPIIQIHDIRYDIFELVMQSLYKGGCENLEIDSSDVLELMAAANFFQLDSLLRFCESMCSKLVRVENVVSMYVHAKVYGAMQLLEYCQGFLLQNMVALLTYDDSVRRLIFGKKLHNHDVLSGLLLTLQTRINSRSSTRTGKQ